MKSPVSKSLLQELGFLRIKVQRISYKKYIIFSNVH